MKTRHFTIEKMPFLNFKIYKMKFNNKMSNTISILKKYKN